MARSPVYHIANIEERNNTWTEGEVKEAYISVADVFELPIHAKYVPGAKIRFPT